MESIENQALLKKLNAKAEEIRSESFAFKKAIKGSSMSDETDKTVFTGFTEHLQTLFDEFSQIANQITSLDDPELLDLQKKDVAVFYSRFVKMQHQLGIIDAPQYDCSSNDDEWSTADPSIADTEEEAEESIEDAFPEEVADEPLALAMPKKKKKRSYRFPAKASTIEAVIADQSAYWDEESARQKEQIRQDAMRLEQYQKTQAQQKLYAQYLNAQNGDTILQSLTLSEQKAESERRKNERQRQDHAAATNNERISFRQSHSEIANSPDYPLSSTQTPDQHFRYNVLPEKNTEGLYRNPKKESTGPAIRNGSVSPFPGINCATTQKANHSKSDSPAPGTSHASLDFSVISPAAFSEASMVSHRYPRLEKYRFESSFNRADPSLYSQNPSLFHDLRRKNPREPDRPGNTAARKGPQEPDRPENVTARKGSQEPGRPGNASDYRGQNQSTHPNRGLAEVEEIRSAEKKLVHQQKSKRLTYRLKSIQSEIGYGVTATVRTAGQRYIDKLDNDVIRYAMKADYYRYIGSAAIGVAQGMLKNPASDLRLNATAELSSRQMAKYNAAAIRNGKNLKEQIEDVKAKYDALSPKDKNGVKGKELRNQIHKLKSQIPSSNKAAAVAKNVQSFQHERVLDQKVLDALSDKNGKVSKRLKSIDARGNEFLKVQKNQMQKRFDARYQALSNEKVQDQIQKITKAAQAKKLQIRLLERQGTKLSVSDRARLKALKADLKANGKEIGKLKSLLQNRSDLTYLEKQVGSVVQRARKFKQNKKSLIGLVRSTMLRPLYNPENNTEYLAKATSLPFNPLIQFGYRATKATVGAPIKLVTAGTKKFTPDIYNHFHFAQDTFTAWKKQLKKASRKELYLQKQRLWDRLPEGMQNYWKQLRHKMDACKKVNVEFHQRIQRMKEWAEKTKIMRLRRAAQRKLKKITEYFQKAGRLFRAVCIKGLITIILIGVVAAAIPTFLAIVSTCFSSIIASPHETTDGKIDLSSFTAVIDKEKQKFSAQRADFERAFTEEVEKKSEQFNRRYNNPPKSQFLEIDEYIDEDSEITISFDGPSENSREMIAMMAVRFEQDLENPDAIKYLKYIAGKSRTLVTASDKTWQHDPGCVLVRTMVSDDSKPTPKPPKPTPGGGGGSHVLPGIRSKPSAVRSSGGSHVVVPTPGGGSHIVVPTPDGGSHIVVPTDPTDPTEPKFIDQWICPGHRKMEINIHVLSLEELYAADDYVGGVDGWEGWTEDNKEWVQLMLDMDWNELYSGFHAGGFIGSISSLISPEEERHIWDYLSNFTGNEYAAAGIMGNLLAESRLLSTNLQDKYEDIVGYTDDTYTAAVDDGTYTNFVEDAAGYGLAQWTDKNRKRKLYNFAKSRNTSIGDLDMQLDFTAHEMETWSTGPMTDRLSEFSSVEDASNYILEVYENPEDPEATRQTRINYSSYFYNKYVLGIDAEGNLTQAQRDVIEIAANSFAYGIIAQEGYCQRWASHVYERAGFAADSSSCARVSGERFGVSSDFTCVPPGAAVYGYSNSRYGHVGIYVGGGLVYDCIGDNDVMESSLEWWINYYNGFCWGWEGGTDLTALP